MQNHSISITLDEAFTQLEDVLDFHASRNTEGTGLYDVVRSFCHLGEDADGAKIYGTAYKVTAHIPAEWPTTDVNHPWITVTSPDLVDAFDQLAALIVAAAPVSA